jgi:hypothetical protein
LISPLRRRSACRVPEVLDALRGLEPLWGVDHKIGLDEQGREAIERGTTGSRRHDGQTSSAGCEWVTERLTHRPDEPRAREAWDCARCTVAHVWRVCVLSHTSEGDCCGRPLPNAQASRTPILSLGSTASASTPAR